MPEPRARVGGFWKRGRWDNKFITLKLTGEREMNDKCFGGGDCVVGGYCDKCQHTSESELSDLLCVGQVKKGDIVNANH